VRSRSCEYVAEGEGGRTPGAVGQGVIKHGFMLCFLVSFLRVRGARYGYKDVFPDKADMTGYLTFLRLVIVMNAF